MSTAQESTSTSTAAPSPPSQARSVVCGIVWPSLVKNEEQLAALRKLPCLSDDVFIATYPKCGTHWIHKICNLILKTDHLMCPAEFNRWDLGPSWHGKGKGKGNLVHDELPGPRVVSLHTPVAFLPEDVERLKCPVVYMVRQPKDVLVSYFHFAKNNPMLESFDSLEDFVEVFLAGAANGSVEEATAAGCPYGGYAKHVLDFVEASKDGRLNVHFMNYEKLLKDTAEGVRALGKFLGKDLTDEEVASVVQASSFDSMKQEQAKQDGPDDGGKGGTKWSEVLFRKGAAGDGKSELSEENSRRLDEVFGKALAGLEWLFGETRPEAEADTSATPESEVGAAA